MSCTAAYHRPKTWAEFVRITVNRRPWPDAGTIIGECPKCRSTISWDLDEEGNIPMKRNPAVGQHPDLFESGMTPIFVPIGELSKAQLLELPLTAFSSEEIRGLSPDLLKQIAQNQRSGIVEALVEKDLWNDIPEKVATLLLDGEPRELQLSDAWDSLSDYEQEYFIENNDEIQKLVEAVVKPFKDAYESANNPSHDYLLEIVDTDYFSQWLQERADELVDLARNSGWGSQIDDIVEEHTANGYSEEQVLQAIDEALREVDNYDKEVSDSGFFVENVSTGWMSVDAPWEEAQKLHPEELKIAIEQINRVTDDALRRYNQVTAERLTKKNQTFEADWENENHVSFDPDWRAIERAVESTLEDIELEGGEGGEERPAVPERSLEERIVHRWKDGFYVVELLPSEFVEEGAPYRCAEHGPFYPKDGDLYGHKKTAPCPVCGAMSPRNEGSLFHCIGSPDQRFCRVARKGQGKGWSLRSPGGKRKLAIFADLDADGTIRKIDQVKGYRNRLPGIPSIDRDSVNEPTKDLPFSKMSREQIDEYIAKKFSPDEVVKAAEFIASLGVDPGKVNDLWISMKKLTEMAVTKKTREYDKAVETLRGISPALDEVADYIQAEVNTETEALRRFDEGVARLPGGARQNPARRPRVCRHCGGEAGGFCG